MSKRMQSSIVILSALVAISTAALVGWLVYFLLLGGKTFATVVPDNQIGTVPAAAQTQSLRPLGRTAAMEAAAPVRAMSGTTLQTGTSANAAAIALYKGRPDDNEQFRVNNMLPGDTQTRRFAVKVSHHADAELYFRATVTSQTKDLADVLHIRVTHTQDNTVLCDGPFSQLKQEGYSVTLAADQSRETVAAYTIEVYLPESVGNAHQAAALHADFQWYIKDAGVLDPPKTGDTGNIVFWGAICASSMAVVVLLLLTRRRKKEAEQNAQ